MSDRHKTAKWIWTIGLFLTLALTATGSWGAEKRVLKQVNALGTAVIHQKNLVDGRQNAVDDALVAAVGQVVMEMLTGETVVQRFQVINDNILAQRDTYIQNYRVLTESITGTTVRTLVQVDVAVDLVSRDLSGLGLVAGQQDQDRSAVIEVDVEGTSGQIASFVRLRTAITSLSGVKELKMKEMAADRATMAVTYQGTARSMADALLLKSFSGFRIDIYDVTSEAIRIRLVKQ